MKRIILFTTLLLGIYAMLNAQKLSEPMENAVNVCKNLSDAIAAGGNTAQIKAANKALKVAKIVNFGDLWLVEGNDISVDGHYVFNEEFIDSLIENHLIIEFSSKYAQLREVTVGGNGKIKMTTRAIKAGESCIWKTINKRNAEYAIVAEPGGLFTMTIRDENGNVLYTETKKNKKGAPVRKAKIQLPDARTRIFIEVKNNGEEDASFAILGN